MTATRVGAVLRSQASLLAFLATYVVALVWFSSSSEHRGLLTPDGAIDPLFVGFGLFVLVMRSFVLFVVPGIVVYRVVRWALRSMRSSGA